MILEPVELVVLALAAYRLAHVLAGADSLLVGAQRTVREWAWETDDCGDPLTDACDAPTLREFRGDFDGWHWTAAMARGKVATLLTCPFCLGYWVGLVMLCVWAAAWPWQLGWHGWITSLAVAGVQSFLTAVDGRG